MLKRSALLFLSLTVLFPFPSYSAGRRPPMAGIDSVSYLPHVEKLTDRYRLTIQSPEPLPHYLIEKSPKKVWLRLVKPSSDLTQVLEGDSVIREVRLVQRQYSADMIVKLGDDAVSNDVYFDDGKKSIVVDVFTSDRISKAVAAAPTDAAQEPVLKDKKAARLARRATRAFVKKKLVPPVLTAAKSPAISSKKEEPQIVAAPAVAPIKRSSGEQIVVIDAGHGGMDSGAIGTRGTLEKDLNLQFAQALAKELSNEKNIRVIMTRNKDEFIPLQERTRIANEAGADLFISVHCNSSLSPKQIGFETYFLSPDATDKAAAAVARLENSVVALEAHKGSGSNRLSEMLASMAVGNFINESSKFAALVCRNVRSHTAEDKTEAKEADFFVLRGAQMPAILIELEYVSNPISELKLRSSRFRAQLVDAVIEGVKGYTRQARQEREAVASQLSSEALVNTAR